MKCKNVMLHKWRLLLFLTLFLLINIHVGEGAPKDAKHKDGKKEKIAERKNKINGSKDSLGGKKEQIDPKKKGNSTINEKKNENLGVDERKEKIKLGQRKGKRDRKKGRIQRQKGRLDGKNRKEKSDRRIGTMIGRKWKMYQRKKKEDGRREKIEFFIKQMITALNNVHHKDRVKFMHKCGNRENPCSTSSIGNSTDIRWTDGVKKETQARFWSIYRCIMKKKVKLCPVDGGWAPWTQWDRCEAECGDRGKIKRTRECTNPMTRNSGFPCNGTNIQWKLCNGECDPKVEKLKSRLEASGFLKKVHKTYPILNSTCIDQHCTYKELGEILKSPHKKEKYWSSLHCYKYHRACPVDGGWTSWNSWSTCSPKCGNGFRYRSRNCSNPIPSNGGYECAGKFYEEDECVGYNCKKKENSPILSDWSKFSTCSAPCGAYGVQEKARHCLNINACRSLLDVDQYGKLAIRKPCYNGPCPIIGKWSTWSSFSQSSAVCGMGRVTRSRVCNRDKPVDGTFCVGRVIERRLQKGPCTVRALKNYKSKSRSAGKQSNKTNTDKPPVGDFVIVPLDSSKEHLYTHWTSWTKCTKSCFTGTRLRIRKCIKSKGLKCKGEIWQTQPCNMFTCPVNGGWSQWEQWSTCSVTCATGTRVRYRRCDQPYPQFGGACLGISEEKSSCSIHVRCDIRMSFTQWSDWSKCSKSCNGGTKFSKRSCKKPNDKMRKYYYKYRCSGKNIKAVSICNAKPCPVNGNWGNWNTWSGCSKYCGIGFHYRDRTCTYPAPKYNGGICSGPGTDKLSCFKTPCTGLIHNGVSLKNGYLFYRKRGRPAGFFSLYLQFKPHFYRNYRLLKHRFNGCQVMKTCKSALEVSMKEKRIKVTLNHTGTTVTMQTDDNSIQIKKWHSIYVHLSEEKLFLRLDDHKKYEKAIKKKKGTKMNFDGYTIVGLFTGELSSLRINLKEYLLHRTHRKQVIAPIKTAKTNKHITFKANSPDAIVSYSIFRGNSFIKIPIRKANRLKVRLVFFAMSPDGILLFNRGQMAASYMSFVIIKGALKFCISDSKDKKCESILNINTYKWYTVSVDISNTTANIRINHGTAIQISLTNKPFIPVDVLCVGGGEKQDRLLFLMTIRSSAGFHGVINEVRVNDKLYPMISKPIMNANGILSSIGINMPEKVTEVYEHQDSTVSLHCDYSKYMKKDRNTSLEWFDEDMLLKPDTSRQMPGKGFVSELTLLPSPKQTGLYSCAIVQDGVFQISHVFILIRHDVKIEHVAEEVELLGLGVFVVFDVILLCCCGVCAISIRVMQVRKQKLTKMKQEITKSMLDTSHDVGELAVTADEKTGKYVDTAEILQQSIDADTTDELDTTGVTDDLDTTGQTDEKGASDRDTSSQSEALDTTGQSEKSKDGEPDTETVVHTAYNDESDETDEEIVHFERKRLKDTLKEDIQQRGIMTSNSRNASKGSVHWPVETVRNTGTLQKRSQQRIDQQLQHEIAKTGQTKDFTLMYSRPDSQHRIGQQLQQDITRTGKMQDMTLQDEHMTSQQRIDQQLQEEIAKTGQTKDFTLMYSRPDSQHRIGQQLQQDITRTGKMPDMTLQDEHMTSQQRIDQQLQEEIAKTGQTKDFTLMYSRPDSQHRIGQQLQQDITRTGNMQDMTLQDEHMTSQQRIDQQLQEEIAKTGQTKDFTLMYSRPDSQQRIGQQLQQEITRTGQQDMTLQHSRLPSQQNVNLSNSRPPFQQHIGQRLQEDMSQNEQKQQQRQDILLPYSRLSSHQNVNQRSPETRTYENQIQSIKQSQHSRLLSDQRINRSPLTSTTAMDQRTSMGQAHGVSRPGLPSQQPMRHQSPDSAARTRHDQSLSRSQQLSTKHLRQQSAETTTKMEPGQGISRQQLPTEQPIRQQLAEAKSHMEVGQNLSRSQPPTRQPVNQRLQDSRASINKGQGLSHTQRPAQQSSRQQSPDSRTTIGQGQVLSRSQLPIQQPIRQQSPDSRTTIGQGQVLSRSQLPIEQSMRQQSPDLRANIEQGQGLTRPQRPTQQPIRQQSPDSKANIGQGQGLTRPQRPIQQSIRQQSPDSRTSMEQDQVITRSQLPAQQIMQRQSPDLRATMAQGQGLPRSQLPTKQPIRQQSPDSRTTIGQGQVLSGSQLPIQHPIRQQSPDSRANIEQGQGLTRPQRPTQQSIRQQSPNSRANIEQGQDLTRPQRPTQQSIRQQSPDSRTSMEQDQVMSRSQLPAQQIMHRQSPDLRASMTQGQGLPRSQLPLQQPMRRQSAEARTNLEQKSDMTLSDILYTSRSNETHQASKSDVTRSRSPPRIIPSSNRQAGKTLERESVARQISHTSQSSGAESIERHMDSKGGKSFDIFSKSPIFPDEVRTDIVHRESDSSRISLPPTGSPSKPYITQIDHHRVETSPSKTSPLRTLPSPPKRVSSEQRVLPSPPKSIIREHRTLPSPPKSTTSEQRTVPSPLKGLISPPKTASAPAIPRTLPSPTKAQKDDDIIIKSDESDDNISVHSLLSIHHRSTSKLEPISLSSSENLIESTNL